jgi:hypothetical protein
MQRSTFAIMPRTAGGVGHPFDSTYTI